MGNKHKQPFLKITRIIFTVILVLFANLSYAKNISGYNDLVSQYAKDLSEKEQAAFRASITASAHNALDNILRKELSATQVERRHIFRQSEERPTKIFEYNDGYAAIGFEKMLHHRGVWEKAAYLLLFHVKNTNDIKYMDNYLFWKGNNSVEEYKRISNSDLCQSFPILAQTGACNHSITKKIAAVETPKQSVGVESSLATKVADLNAKLNNINASIAKKADKRHTHPGGDITSGIIREAFIDSAIARDREISGARRTVSNANADSTNVAELENRVEELENTVKELTELLSGVSRNQNDIVFSGMNVHIVNGTGSTEGTVNGTGNLIVGYNQSRNGNDTPERTGSHNIVLGDGHEYTSYGGFVAGLSNTISGSYSSVTGGLRNVASGDYSTVNGGHFKTAEGVYSVAVPDDATVPEKSEKKKSGCFIGQLQ